MVLVFVFSNTVGLSFLSFYFPPARPFHSAFPGLLPEGLLEKYFIYQELRLFRLELVEVGYVFFCFYSNIVHNCR